MATVFKRGGKKNRDGYYYVAWRDHNGKRRTRCTKTTDKAAAERIAKKLETDAALRRDREIDPALDAISQQAHRPVMEHWTTSRPSCGRPTGRKSTFSTRPESSRQFAKRPASR